MSIADGLPTRHRRTALLVVLPLLCLAVTVESHAIRSGVPLSVVFALDVSDSMSGSDQSVSYITDTVQQVTEKIEKKLQEAPSLDNIRSYTTPGLATILVNLKESVSPKRAIAAVRAGRTSRQSPTMPTSA